MTSISPDSGNVAIAIDGPAASGKSTLARILAEQLGLVMVNSGAMYRAVTWKVLREGVDPHDAAAVIAVLHRTTLECGDDGRYSTIKVDGIDPGDELRGEAVNSNVSAVSAVPEVRDALVALQREYLKRASVVMEGRDIGSVVFPDTPYKIYVDADEEVRAARRRDAGELDAVSKRDAADSRRATAPLIVANGATVLDTSDHTIESGVAAAIEILEKQGLKLL
ncbi:(d)CMP kinase [Luteolibacter sp. LG18]|uniref:(d)CMP kinase n=1 Tax=Luteolibacter sp. LG18 TaxID=2819286 RepID=UPI002B2DA0CC|nr:cytidylate kinase [Luteolibacter sp. LG18]